MTRNTRIAALLIGLLLAGSVQAQIYRWVDQSGRVQYSNVKPPKEIQATIVEADAKAAPAEPAGTECHTIRCQGERLDERQRLRDAEDARIRERRAAVAPKPPRGLDFRDYLRIQRGMSEGELLGVAGQPDFMSDQGIAMDVPTTVQVDRNTRVSASGAQRTVTWTYLPTPADPFTTTITLIGGRVAEVDRVRKF